MDNELTSQLQNLIQQWDELADQARRRGESERERYYYGIALGLKAAKADLTRVLKKTSPIEVRKPASAGK
jgi:hypothetical protein